MTILTARKAARFAIRRTCPGRWLLVDRHREHVTWHPTWDAAMAHAIARTEIRPTRRAA